MAKDSTQTITQVYVNNSKTPTTVSKVVENVVINNHLVPDPRDVNPGVIDKGFKRS